MNLTPHAIRKDYDSAPLYHKEACSERYRGQKICWDLECSSIGEHSKGGNLMVMLREPKQEDRLRETVVTFIKEDSFPLIKLFHEGQPVRLSGSISKVTALAIHIESASLQEVRNEAGQIYFGNGSREDFLAHLTNRLRGASKVDIYDPHVDIGILKLLEETSPSVEIRILSKERSLDGNFTSSVAAFGTYFKKKIEARKSNSAHDRFYIIDGITLSAGSSLKNGGGDKATMVHLLDEENARKARADFETWWKENPSAE